MAIPTWVGVHRVYECHDTTLEDENAVCADEVPRMDPSSRTEETAEPSSNETPRNSDREELLRGALLFFFVLFVAVRVPIRAVAWCIIHDNSDDECAKNTRTQHRA